MFSLSERALHNYADPNLSFPYSALETPKLFRLIT